MDYCDSNFSESDKQQKNQEVKETLDALAEQDPVLKEKMNDEQGTLDAIIQSDEQGISDTVTRAQYVILVLTLLTPDDVKKMNTQIKDQKDAYGKAIAPDIAFRDYMGYMFWKKTGKTYSGLGR